MDDDAAHRYRVVDLSRAAMKRTDRCYPARKHREVGESLDPGKIPDHPVDDEAREPAVTCLGADEVTERCGVARPTRVHDHDIARTGDVEALVHHEVVPRVHLHSAGGAEDSERWVRDVP